MKFQCAFITDHLVDPRSEHRSRHVRHWPMICAPSPSREGCHPGNNPGAELPLITNLFLELRSSNRCNLIKLIDILIIIIIIIHTRNCFGVVVISASSFVEFRLQEITAKSFDCKVTEPIYLVGNIRKGPTKC